VRTLKRENVRRLRRRLGVYERQYESGALGREEVEKRLGSWLSHAAHGNTGALRHKVQNRVRSWWERDKSQTEEGVIDEKREK
jgi:hypothetical protein